MSLDKTSAGYQKYEPLMKDQINYPGYDAIVCHGDGGSGVEYNDYEEVESAFLVSKMSDELRPYKVVSIVSRCLRQVK